MPVLLEESIIYDPYDAYLSQISGDRFRYNEFHNKLKQLPNNFLDFVFSTGLGDFIKDKISIPLSLNQNQSKELAMVVLELILKDIYLGNIVGGIQNRLRVEDQKAKIIAGLIVAELFAPILDELKKKHIDKFAKMTVGGDESVIDLRKEFKI